MVKVYKKSDRRRFHTKNHKTEIPNTINASLVGMSEKQVFEEILTGIRADLRFLKGELLSTLKKKRLNDPYGKKDEVKDWILDVFLDKLFETHAKVEGIFKAFNIQRDLPIWEMKRLADERAFDRGYVDRATQAGEIEDLGRRIQQYEVIFEKTMGTIRKLLHDQNWEPMKRIDRENYTLAIKRTRYVQARDELEEAKQAVKNKNWGEVFNHIRPAIDLSIKERFGFKKIHPMKNFLKEAEKHNFPLPSYDMIYRYFDEASQRLHEGRLHTPWECQEALEFVAKFIDRLDLIDIAEEDIEEFKTKSKSVE